MQNKKFLRACVLTTVMLSLSIGAVFAGGQSEKAEDSEKTFIVARSTDAQTLDAGYAWSEGEIDLMFHLYDGLVRFKNDQLEVEPALATSWNRSDDGLVWTFNLREGVKFHDGTDFNAEVVRFSFMRLIDQDHEFYGLGDYSYFDYLLSEVIEDIKVVDTYTVEFQLKNKFAPFLTYMGYYSQFPVSMAAVKEKGEEFYRNPVGTGPFEFVEWKKDEYIVLKRNENYWGEKPTVDKVIWKVVPDISTRFLELQSGQVHAIKGLAPNQIESVKGNDKMVLHQVPGANIFHMVFNNTMPPVDDVRVRQAIAYGIDLEKLVKGVYEGLGTVASTSLPPTVFGHADNIEHYPYDPQKARELLKEAGYADGLDITLNTFIHARPYVANPVDSAEVIKDDLAKVGINVNIESNEWGTHSDLMNNYKHQMAFSGWYDVPYPSNFMKTMLMEGANTNWKPQEMVDLVQKAISTYDRVEQEQAYLEMQAIEHEQVPALPIAHNDYTAASAAGVTGFELDVIGTVRAHEVDFD
ncbi:MAG: ABC transporter substrate-binding protein [Spirochaetia bacterium]|nr:ABC transporter substrate-binding protein [Spirochaetia bacterium]